MLIASHWLNTFLPQDYDVYIQRDGEDEPQLIEGRWQDEEVTPDDVVFTEFESAGELQRVFPSFDVPYAAYTQCVLRPYQSLEHALKFPEDLQVELGLRPGEERAHPEAWDYYNSNIDPLIDAEAARHDDLGGAPVPVEEPNPADVSQPSSQSPGA